jgi:hypothetical protein
MFLGFYGAPRKDTFPKKDQKINSNIHKKIMAEAK